MKKALMFIVSFGMLFASCDEQFSSEQRSVNVVPVGQQPKTSGVSLPFTAAIGSPLDAEIARQWMKNYQEKYPQDLKSHYFGRDAFDGILAGRDVIGIQICYALDNNGDRKLLLVPVLSDGTMRIEGDSQTGSVVDFSAPCPLMCPKD